MDKSQAIYQFWSGFGIPAYDESSVPDDAQFPYITYSQATDSLDAPVVLTAHVWDRSPSWERVSKIVESMGTMVGEYGFKIMKIDGGYVWFKQGHPFSQRMPVESDDLIRRVYVIMMAEFLTAY